MSVKSLDNNTFKKPELDSKYMEKNKIKKTFQIIIPNYNSETIEIPRLNCIYEIMINENFIIYIIIDAIIKSNIYKLFVYGFFTKNYFEKEVTIYLREKAKETLDKRKSCIKLKFALYSINNKKNKFSLNFNECKGIRILPEEKIMRLKTVFVFLFVKLKLNIYLIKRKYHI